MDHTVHGILQARILERAASPFSRGSQPRDRTQVSGIAGRFLRQKGSPRILKRVAYPFSSGSSLLRNLLHCRQTLDQLSYQGSPMPGKTEGKRRRERQRMR